VDVSRRARRPTANAYRRRMNRLDALNVAVAKVRDAMRRGASLHCIYRDGLPIWLLSSGSRVNGEVARILAADPNIVAVDLPLFAGSPPQTLRWCDQSNTNNEDHHG